MYRRGEYSPLTLDEAVAVTKEMYRILDAAGINIIRVGLKSTDIINEDGAITGGTYHPAFRQLVESSIAREEIEKQLTATSGNISVMCNPSDISNAAGHNGCNRKYFAGKYPGLHISFKKEESLDRNKYIVIQC